MPTVTLTDAELADAAQALRAASWRAEQDAKVQGTATTSRPFAESALRYAALAEKLERVRGGGSAR